MLLKFQENYMGQRTVKGNLAKNKTTTYIQTSGSIKTILEQDERGGKSKLTIDKTDPNNIVISKETYNPS
jgi:hypothetical protein